MLFMILFFIFGVLGMIWVFIYGTKMDNEMWKILEEDQKMMDKYGDIFDSKDLLSMASTLLPELNLPYPKNVDKSKKPIIKKIGKVDKSKKPIIKKIGKKDKSFKGVVRVVRKGN